MADKSNKVVTNVAGKPVPMKLFAAWEIDRTPPNCIPRLCTLNLTRLVLLKPLGGGDSNSVIIAVKMQSSKRTLRSNEITVPSNGLLDTELDFTFSLQYPHFLKRSGNHLHIMLQRRKRYKNRTMLGFKTLAGGVINMAEVLQRPMDKELELYSDVKDKNELIARIVMVALSSQPVDHEVERQKLATDAERGAEVDNFSDEEEEYTSNEEGCDSEPVAEDAPIQLHTGSNIDHRRSQFRKVLNQKMFSSNEDRPDSSERNIKQKFIALLKKFRIPETEVSDSEQYQEELEQELISQNPQEIEDLFDDLDDLTDSGPEVDDVSISSTPKPSLRPFFSSGTLNEKYHLVTDKLSDDNIKKYENDNHHESGTDQEYTDTSQTASSPPKITNSEEKKSSEKEKKTRLFTREKNVSSSKEKRSSSIKELKDKSVVEKPVSRESEISPQKSVLEQLAKIFPSDDSIPDHLFLISTIDGIGNCLANQLQDQEHWVVAVSSNSDLRASVSCLVNKIQKFCNCNSRAPPTIKIGLLGLDSFINSVLRLYVEQFSSKSPDWQGYVRFLIVPLGVSTIAKYLGTTDSTYGANFLDTSWKELLDHCTESTLNPAIQEVVTRILNYLNGANGLYQIPVAEAMVTYKEKSSDDESSQVFIPFISDVKIGMMDGIQTTSVDLEEQQPLSNLIIPGSSPPANSSEKTPRESITPPNSPSISTTFIGSSSGGAGTPTQPGPAVLETMDLQLDYWTSAPRGEVGKKTESSKYSVKNTFRNLQVSRFPAQGEFGTTYLTLSYTTKEKKQKIMRLGKKREKEKEPDNRCQQVENINRLICSCKSPQIPLKVIIDGVEWSGVKFFQLTSQWQTHIKYFPATVFMPQEHLT